MKPLAQPRRFELRPTPLTLEHQLLINRVFVGSHSPALDIVCAIHEASERPAHPPPGQTRFHGLACVGTATRVHLDCVSISASGPGVPTWADPALRENPRNYVITAIQHRLLGLVTLVLCTRSRCDGVQAIGTMPIRPTPQNCGRKPYERFCGSRLSQHITERA